MLLPEVDADGGEAHSSFARLYDTLRRKVGELGPQARLTEGGEAGEEIGLGERGSRVAPVFRRA